MQAQRLSLCPSCDACPEVVLAEHGLLRPSARTASGYRLYAPDAVDRLRFIRRARTGVQPAGHSRHPGRPRRGMRAVRPRRGSRRPAVAGHRRPTGATPCAPRGAPRPQVSVEGHHRGGNEPRGSALSLPGRRRREPPLAARSHLPPWNVGVSAVSSRTPARHPTRGRLRLAAPDS